MNFGEHFQMEHPKRFIWIWVNRRLGIFGDSNIFLAAIFTTVSEHPVKVNLNRGYDSTSSAAH